MSITTVVSRIGKLNEDLMTINNLRSLKKMSGKNLKPCSCVHHRSTSKSRNPNKCKCHGRDKNVRCSDSLRPKICLCDHSDGPSVIENWGPDGDLKSQSESPPHPAKQQREMIKEMRNENEKPGKQEETKRTAVAIRTNDIANKSETENVNGDKKDIEQMYKDLESERKRNRELEEKLEKMTCSIECLKDEGEQRANCLKNSLEKAKNQAKLAARSRNLAMDLAKQSRDQTDHVKASRDEVLKQINAVKSENSKLQCECQELRSKLQSISENEAKKCAEVDDKVNRIKCAVKQKEIALASEKSELEETVAELTNLVKIQKKRICDLTSICTKQRSALRNNENCISSKIAQLSDAKNDLRSMDCRCKKMQEEIECLKCCLQKETEARNKLQAEFDDRCDNCNCEMQIKDKIIADQVETIKKLKKLLQDSEKMAHQASREFESLRAELHCLKRSNESLIVALEDAEARIVSDESERSEPGCCERCRILECQIVNLAEQKHKALTAAKFATEKLGKTSAEYQRLLDCEKRQHRIVADLVHRKQTEIELLKKEILHNDKYRSRRSDDYIVQ